MVVLQVYTKCVKTKYKVRFLSKGTLVFILANLFSIIIPFIIAYKSGGYWLKRDTFYETPDFRFIGKYLLLTETNNISYPITCSSYPLYTEYFKQFLACSQIKVREVDNNNDKKYDELSLELKINLPQNIEIYSYTLIIPIEMKLQEPSCPLEMQSGIILQQTLPKKISKLSVFADLTIQQSYPLYCSSKMVNTVFNYSLINNENNIKDYKLENIISSYRARNLTTTLSNILTIQEAIHKNSLILNINIRYTEQMFYYKTPFFQTMKWAWIQFYAIYIIIYFIVSQIKRFIFDNRLVLYYKENPKEFNKK